MSKKTTIIIAVTIGFIFIGGSIIFSGTDKVTDPLPVTGKISENKEVREKLSKNKTIMRGGKEFVIEETKPVVITIVNDRNCRECDTKKLLEWLKVQLGSTLALRRIDFNSEEGKDLIKKYEAPHLPFLLVGKEVEKKGNLDHLTHHILTSVKDNYFVDLEKIGAPVGKYLWATYYSKSDPEAPKLTAMTISYDFGDVSLKKGIVKTEFNIKNTGKKPLEFLNIATSCGCTSVQVKLASDISPSFTMPGHKEPVKWRGKLAPGEDAKLIVYYDPNVHKDLVGAVTREVYVRTNDPATPEMKFRIRVNQTT